MARKDSDVVKLAQRDLARLRNIASNEDRTIADIITDLLDRYETERFWSGVKGDLEKLEADPKAKAHYDAEIAAWESTVSDGLENETS